MERITRTQLEAAVKNLNAILGRPAEPYTKYAGQLRGNAGHILLGHDACGWSVAEMCESTGERTPFGSWRLTARECYMVLIALQGAAREFNKVA